MRKMMQQMNKMGGAQKALGAMSGNMKRR